ncbi:hypothetical protein C5L30_000257 [Companilactobacillus farciminis]|jgi:hypothetical protein|uniref:Uncharacterized protein n=1 Tax=Companilactobacillus farciminis TaxID=1612 RepID=A0A4R5NJB0_9LACO|nr:hypothetical protein [Companilactobacillus farciminis]ATO46092.1 hypothetical protein LF20184_04690 [Companilactobacillus farciminis KCTC 3681 = DSM 20184]KRK62477.1 hypothetical protein FC68_GL002004 [Companilactobacillus farciminis KCTC 3681 = DSM 20184]TDG74541.1 hypothetical protein C5L30_000257 [Companilactobacillus farciminis]
MDYKTSKNEETLWEFTKRELEAEGFNPVMWRIKEVPLDEIFTICNIYDNTEFAVYYENSKYHFGYYAESRNGAYELLEAEKITTAIESSEE